ncbi:uncharacterized protein LOC124886682 [Capsicum annuum]|uniref:uncharacterized protein LOC124886682 n=1 Tax=Capsicum annuum TaxID=4072 RepID=UPI001FB18ACD|nr:uncharacterized protein LOC124886682 [Capsicum annuum]
MTPHEAWSRRKPNIEYFWIFGCITYARIPDSARKKLDDKASSGSIMSKITAEAIQLLNEISENAVQWPSDRIIIKKAAGVNQVEVLNSLTQQITALTQKFETFQNNYLFGSSMTHTHPEFQWSNLNGAENPQKYFNQKQQVQESSDFQNQMRGQHNYQQYQQQPQRAHQQNLEEMMNKFIWVTDEKIESHHSAIKKLEIQVSQLATLISGQIQGVLPSNTKKNSKKHLKVISLRSGKNLNDPYASRQESTREVEQVNEDALSQMPSYAKFLKEILSSKRKLEEVSVVKLIEKCSAILQNKLPQKLDDPKSFTISCTLGGAHFEKALCDSGVSVNLMSFSIFKKLELCKIKDTGVSLQLTDQSTKNSKEIIEDVLIRVDKFAFPVNFIVLEMEENTEVSLILGRPFLATERAIIDVHQGQLILRVDEERVIFDMQKIIKFSENESSSSCFHIDLLDDLTDEYKDDQLITDSLERCLAKSGTTSDDDPTIRKEVEMLKENIVNEENSLEEVQPKIKLKTLPSYLKYIFLESELCPVSISSSLTTEQENKLIGVLKEHKRAIGWTIADIKGISLAICTHKILMEDNYKPIVQPQ